MKFLVFIKQVPNSAEIQFDSARKTLVRDGVKNEMNAYDRRAITEAIRYRNENGGQVVAVCMGPPQAKDALREALIMGVDSCVHIQDSRLAGSDTLITSRVLAAAAKRLGYDIIFCGQHSTDSETGQVPVELAELLMLPCAIAVRKIEYLPDRMIQVTSETDEGSMLLEMSLPAVLSAAERLIRPLKTKNADLTRAPDEKIQTIDLKDLDLSESEVGLQASPTWVSEILDVRMHRSPEIWDGSDVQATAVRILEEIKRIRKGTGRMGEIDRIEKEKALDRVGEMGRTTNHTGSNAKSYWCWVEFLQAEIRPVSLEILATTANLASQKGASVSAIVTGYLSPEIKNILAEHGANRIFNLPATEIHPDQIVSVLCEQILLQQPDAFFLPATRNGKYLAPRIAARLGLGLTGDCVGLIQSGEDLAYLKPAFGGNIVAPVFCRTFPQMATIRPGALDRRSPVRVMDPEVVHWHIPEAVLPQFTIVAQEIDPGIEAVRLDNAKFVIGIGAGFGQANLPLAQRLAVLLDGSLGATRRVVDSGWMPRQFQIGLTGKFIAPDIYLGLGVSGRYNHMVGVQKSDFIIAINQDPAADIFGVCDIGVRGDCVAIAGEMIRLLDTMES